METTLLLVDDHPLFRKGLHLLLDEEQDLRVVGEAGDGQTAINMVRELSPDVVVMDITMPELDGIEATRRILAESPAAKVVALSIHAKKQFVENMLRAGAAGYILKESVPEELINGIRTVARGEVFLSETITGVVVSHYMSLLSGSDDEETRRVPADETSATRLITTKLRRPLLTPDLVLRPRLLERLNRWRQQPLTLISAGAGYGKSTLVCHWLETADCPSAWLSLDERDDGLVSFLTYLIAAVRTIFPEAGQKTLALVQAGSLHPIPVLAASLANELDQIETPFILVLDDYHHIRELAIQDLLNELLRHPPQLLHLVIVTRRDPLLDLTNLRARGQVTEIGDQELRFTVAETASFLQLVTEAQVDEAAAAALDQKIEGWVTGLRLSALSLRHQGDLDRLLRSLPENIHHVTDYLMTEIISHQPPAVRDFLLKTAILDRFCAPLADAIMGWGAGELGSQGAEEQRRRGENEITSVPLPPGSPTPSPPHSPAPSAPPPPRPSAPQPSRSPSSSQSILERLQHDKLFIIPLDDQRVWFRYHHLFQQLLQQLLNQTLVPDSISELHRRASAWFSENNLIEEGIRQALAAEDISAAVHLVEQHRYDLMNTEQWNRLDRWLQWLPPETIEKNPKLLTTIAWSGLVFHSRWSESWKDPNRIVKLLSELSPKSPEKTMISAELDALRTTQLFSAGEVDRAIASAERTLGALHPEAHSMRGQTVLVLAMAYQATGQLDRAFKLVHDMRDSYSSVGGFLYAKMLMGLCVINWLEGQIAEMKQPALQLLKSGQEFNLPESVTFGRYFMGSFHYVRNELTEAESYFAAVVKDRFLARAHYYAHCAFGQALCYIAWGRTHEAHQVIESLIKYSMEFDNTWLLQFAQAFQVELAIRQERTAEALSLAEKVFHNFFATMYVFYVPQLTEVKVLLIRNTSESRQKATVVLDNLHNIVVSTHNTRVRIDVLALQALTHDAQGEAPAAFEKLTESLALAEPGRFIRNFVDMGNPMADLLTRLKHQGVAKQSPALSYIDQILAAFQKDEGSGRKDELKPGQVHPTPLAGPGIPQPLIEPLTDRELEVLALLVRRLSNKEIAQELVISPETVKKHTLRIYQKLGVHSRGGAVAKASTLEILTLD